MELHGLGKRLHMKKHLLSVLLVLALLLGMMPVQVFAQEKAQTEEYGSFVDGDQVISDMIEKNGMNAHPRIIMTDQKFKDLKSHLNDGSVTAKLLEELRLEANRIINETTVSTYDAYGDKHLLETSKRIQRHIATLALAYNIYGENQYAQRCYEEMKAACNFPDWSPKHFLDTAEMCTGIAYGYDWIYSWLNKDQRDFIRGNLIKKGLNQVLEDYKDSPADRNRTYKWYQDLEGDNWQLVCTGGTNLAALAIGDEKNARSVAAQVLTYGYKRAYSFVRRAYSAQDGTYLEGLGYWDYATYYLGLQSSALISATGTDYGLADYDGIPRSADFVRYMSSNSPKSFSFGDDRESRDTGWSVFLWVGGHFNLPELTEVRLKKKRKTSDYNYLDVLWIDESQQPASLPQSKTDWGSVGSSNASFRTSWEESGLVTALHAGENCYKYHGHYDLGSFYIESGGSRFFTDLGNEDYELKNRQYSYRIKAEGHNTLVINPTEDIDQAEGANCLITEFKSGNEAYAITDLTDAYKPNGAKRVVRGLKLIKDKNCVVIQDEISLNKAGEIYWFAHTSGQIKVASDGKSAIVTVGSDRLWVKLLNENGRFTVMKAEPLPTSMSVPNATDNSDYRKLAIHLTNTKDTTISVACIPLKNGETTPSWTPTVKALSEWSKGDSTLDLGDHLHGCKLSLSGDIGVNFYMDLSSAVLSEDAYLEFTVPSGKTTETRKVYVKAKKGENRTVAQTVTEGKKTYYVFKCQASAKDYASNIGVRMVDGSKSGKKYSYSVKTYADYLLSHTNDNAEYKKAAPLVKALLCYCTWAQTYFGMNQSLIDRSYLNTDVVSAVTSKEVREAAPASEVVLDQLSGVTFAGSNISLKSETTLSLYFKSSSTLTFSCNRGNKLETAKEDGYQVVRICGISASDFDEIFELKISCGGKEGMIRYSVLNHIYNALCYYSDDTLLSLEKALYLYHKAAEAYS